MAGTIDAIKDDVFTYLRETEGGQKKVCRIDALVAKLNTATAAVREKRLLLRARPGVSFAVNTTQAGNEHLEISVRVHGVDCGVVTFDTAGGRMFAPSRTNFTDLWTDSSGAQAIEWGQPTVAQFIREFRERANRIYVGRESSVQESLFRSMKGNGGKKKTLRGFQPVLFGGVPIQIPLPVTPRGRSEEPSNSSGHADVLARGRPGQLVVFEAKRPGASRTECIGALEQAVRYVAALDYLMSREERRAAAEYWNLFGARRGQVHAPQFVAVAFLNEKNRASYDELSDKLNELMRVNESDYRLRVMLYRQSNGGIEVAREIPPAH